MLAAPRRGLAKAQRGEWRARCRRRRALFAAEGLDALPVFLLDLARLGLLAPRAAVPLGSRLDRALRRLAGLPLQHDRVARVAERRRRRRAAAEDGAGG